MLEPLSDESFLVPFCRVVRILHYVLAVRLRFAVSIIWPIAEIDAWPWVCIFAWFESAEQLDLTTKVADGLAVDVVVAVPILSILTDDSVSILDEVGFVMFEDMILLDLSKDDFARVVIEEIIESLEDTFQVGICRYSVIAMPHDKSVIVISGPKIEISNTVDELRRYVPLLSLDRERQRPIHSRICCRIVGPRDG